MSRQLLRTCILMILLVALIAVVSIFAQMLKSAQTLTAQSATTQTAENSVQSQNASQSLPDHLTTLTKAPFVLLLENREIDDVMYTTFSVYRTTVDDENCLYHCGRMFESSLLRSISWAVDTGTYDIIVTYTNGAELIYGFDGKDGWQ